jgi:hypothetical protein
MKANEQTSRMGQTNNPKNHHLFLIRLFVVLKLDVQYVVIVLTKYYFKYSQGELQRYSSANNNARITHDKARHLAIKDCRLVIGHRSSPMMTDDSSVIIDLK